MVTEPAPERGISMRTPPGRHRKRGGVLLVLLSILLTVFAAWAYLHPSGLVWPDRLLGDVFVAGGIAAFLFGVGLSMAARRRPSRITALGCCLAVGCGWLWLGHVWPFRNDETARVQAPSGAGYEAVVSEGLDGINPVWFVSVRQTRGPLSREWQVGCVVGDDDPPRDVVHVAWNGPELVVTNRAGSVSVAIDPATGRPAADSAELFKSISQ